MKPQESFRLVATVLPADAEDKTVTWKSGATSVVEVSSNGKITAVAYGSTTIRATTANGLTAFCMVTVLSEGVTEVILNKTSATTNVGLTVQLTAMLIPSYAEDKTLTWKSSNSKIAKVSQKGLVTAVRCGTAIITATAATGVKASCKITVSQKYVYECVKSGVYRYTSNTATVKELKSAGWTYKKAFRCAGKSKKPVYQIYNKTTKRYRYTADKAAALAAKNAGSKVSVAFYGSDTTSIPVYELCKEGKKPTYRYTTNKNEAKNLKAKGWKYMGIAFYAELSTLA